MDAPRLTLSQIAAVRLLITGTSYTETAKQLNIKIVATRMRINRAMTKCGARDRAELLLYCLSHPEWIRAPKCEHCGQLLHTDNQFK